MSALNTQISIRDSYPRYSISMFSFGGQPQQQQTGGLFGQAQTNPSPFGVAPPIPGSQTAPTSGGGLFGAASTPASSSLFGAPQPAQPASGGLFGQPSAAPSPFAQPAQTGGMFGQQPAATGGFFGASALPSPVPSAFGGMGTSSPFGAPAGGALGGTGGTSVQKYQTTRDQELNMRLISVTAMDSYKNKSFEELRWEDYQANRSQPGGAAGAPAPAPSGWGAAQPTPTSSGLFGSATTTGGTAFGQPAAAQQPASTGLFGAASPASTGGGLFGATTQGGGMFGSTPSTQPQQSGGGLFGQQPATGGAFGATTSTPSGGMFGSTSTSPTPGGGGLFGSTSTTSGGLFGSSTSTGGGMFGSAAPSAGGGLFGASPAASQPAPSGGGLFGGGSTTAGMFGSQAATPSAGGGLFGATSSTTPAANTGGLFGSTTAPSGGGGLFGATSAGGPSTGGGLFGSTTTGAPASGGGLFGTSTGGPSTGGGLFGATTGAPASGGGLFGTSAPASGGGGLFGTSTGGATTGGGGLFGSTTTAPSGGGLFGTSASTTAGGGAAGGGLFGSGGAATGGGGLFGSSTTTTSSSLFGPSSTTSGGLFGSTATPSSTGGTGLGFAQGGLFGAPATPAAAPLATTLPPVPRPTGLVTPKPVDKDSLSAFLWKDKSSETPLVPKKKSSAPPSPPSPRTFVPVPSAAAALPATTTGALPQETTTTPLRLRTSETPLESPKGAPSIVVRPRIVYTTPTKSGADQSSPAGASRSVLPVCGNHNLWTKPSIEAMAGMTEHELSRVEHFQIGHYGMGSVTWPGLTDVRFLNIDDLIIFKKGSVTLFPDEDLKPPMGTGLNKTAIIELFVRPKNMDLAKKYEARYIDEMRKLTETNGAEFLSYDLEAWRFRVEHFSTWGIDNSLWETIDDNMAGQRVEVKNDLSLFSRIEYDLSRERDRVNEDDAASSMEHDGEREESVLASYSREDFVGALAVAPPTREELKAMGWDLKLMDLFLNQSFRVAIGISGTVVVPEHPVVCDSHNISLINPRESAALSPQQVDQLVALYEKQEVSSSAMSLIHALLEDPSEEGADSGINTSAFNEWLSRVNADRIRSSPSLAFSPSAALSSRDYSPSASELLLKSGHARLALAAAAAHNDTSRRLMKDQLCRIQDANPETQRVAQILGGRIEALDELDWRSELALRYWYCDGDLNGFEPPANSIEWRIIRAVVLGDSSELFKLLDDPSLSVQGKSELFVAMQLVKSKKPELVSDDHLSRVSMALADAILASQNWQLAVVVLAILPTSPQREKVIEDLVARHIDQDCSLLVKLGIISESRQRDIARALGL